jgi:hypothetical protein
LSSIEIETTSKNVMAEQQASPAVGSGVKSAGWWRRLALSRSVEAVVGAMMKARERRAKPRIGRSESGQTVEESDSGTMETSDSGTIEVANSKTTETSSSRTLEVSDSRTVEVANSRAIEISDSGITETSDSGTVEVADSKTLLKHIFQRDLAYFATCLLGKLWISKVYAWSKFYQAERVLRFNSHSCILHSRTPPLSSTFVLLGRS